MKTSELLKNTKTKGLSGNAFKAYYVLLSEAKNQKIENFTILGLVKKWTDDEGLKMNTSRNTVKSILRELEDNKRSREQSSLFPRIGAYMKLLIISLISFNVMAMDYEKGFIDGYYQANSFNEKINPCKSIKKVNCSSNDTFKDCHVKQSQRDTSCSIHYLGKKLNYLVEKGAK